MYYSGGLVVMLLLGATVCYKLPDRDNKHILRTTGPPPQVTFGPPPQATFGSPPQVTFGIPPQETFGTPPQETFGTPPQETFGTTPQEVLGTSTEEEFNTPAATMQLPTSPVHQLMYRCWNYYSIIPESAVWNCICECPGCEDELYCFKKHLQERRVKTSDARKTFDDQLQSETDMFGSKRERKHMLRKLEQMRKMRHGWKKHQRQ